MKNFSFILIFSLECHKLKEFVAQLRIILELTGVIGGGHTTFVLYSAHRLASVMTFQYDGKTEGAATKCIGEDIDYVVA